MQRLNHKTGKPFQRGELRHDGKKFAGYGKRVKRNGYFDELWVDAETSNLTTLLSDCRKTARAKNLPFDLDIEYLRSIKVDRCPIFGVLFEWDRFGEGHNKDWVPSLDKFYPELGYVRGNVAFISNKANRIKSDATEREMYMVADWFWNEKKKRNAKKNATTSVSTRTHQQSEDHSELRSILAAWVGQDDYDAHHHCGTISREDLDHRAQASSRDSVGARNQEVVALEAFTRIENNGEPEPEIVRLDFGRRYLSD